MSQCRFRQGAYGNSRNNFAGNSLSLVIRQGVRIRQSGFFILRNGGNGITRNRGIHLHIAKTAYIRNATAFYHIGRHGCRLSFRFCRCCNRSGSRLIRRLRFFSRFITRSTARSRRRRCRRSCRSCFGRRRFGLSRMQGNRLFTALNSGQFLCRFVTGQARSTRCRYARSAYCRIGCPYRAGHNGTHCHNSQKFLVLRLHAKSSVIFVLIQYFADCVVLLVRSLEPVPKS